MDIALLRSKRRGSANRKGHDLSVPTVALGLGLSLAVVVRRLWRWNLRQCGVPRTAKDGASAPGQRQTSLSVEISYDTPSPSRVECQSPSPGGSSPCGSAVAQSTCYCPSASSSDITSLESSCSAGDRIGCADTAASAGSVQAKDASEQQSADREYLSCFGLDRCTVYKELGRGTYGSVDLVEVELPSGAVVRAARKTLLRDGQRGPAAEIDYMFAQELHALRAGAGCAHLVQLLGWASYPDRHELLMEALEGGTLEAELERAAQDARWRKNMRTVMAFTEQRIKEVATSLLRALAHLDANGIVHLDVKTLNIVCSSEGRPVLLDLGGSGRIRSDGSMGGRGGTLLFMSPEMRAGMRDSSICVNAKTDVYSVGLILLQCVAWPTYMGPVEAYLMGRFELPACVPDELRALLEGMTAKDPAQRMSAAQALQHPYLLA